MRRERALVPPHALAGPGALRLGVLQRGRGEAALALLVVVAGGRGVGAAAAVVGGVEVVGVVEGGAWGGGGAAERGAGVLWWRGLVGCEVHVFFFGFFFVGGLGGWLSVEGWPVGFGGRGSSVGLSSSRFARGWPRSAKLSRCTELIGGR